MKQQLSLKDPQTKLLLITIGIILVTYFFSQKFILKPHREKVAKLMAQLEHISLEDEIAKIHTEVIACEKYLPPQKDPSWLLTQITELAAQSRLNIESIEPLPVKQIPPYSYVPFKIKTTCTFNKLINFLALVESSPYILSMESLKIDSQGKYTPEVPKEELNKEIQAGIEVVIGTLY